MAEEGPASNSIPESAIHIAVNADGSEVQLGKGKGSQLLHLLTTSGF